MAGKYGYYNDQNLGQGLSNLASIFAPPSPQELVAGANLQINRAKEARTASAIANIQAGRGSVGDFMAVNPTNGVDQYGRADMYRRYQADPTMTPDRFDTPNYILGGDATKTHAGIQEQPLKPGEVRVKVPAIAASQRVAPTQYGTIQTNKDQRTLVPGPGGRVSAPSPEDVTDEQIARAAFADAVPGGGAPGRFGLSGPSALTDQQIFDIASGRRPQQRAAPGASTPPTGQFTIEGKSTPPSRPMTPEERVAYGGGKAVEGGAFVDGEGRPHMLSQGTQVNIDQRAENAEAKGRGEGLSKRMNDMADDAAKAGEDAMLFQRFGDLLASVGTGKQTEVLERVRQMMGVALDPNTDNVQALNAAINYIAPRLRVPGSGAQSDQELGNFLSSIPSLAGTPDGNRKILDTLSGMVKYRQQRAAVALDWQTGDISAKEAQKRIDALPSPLAALNSRGAPAAPTAPAGPAQAAPAVQHLDVASPSSQPAPGAPAVGAIEDGHRFKGGNPADPNAWERVQ